MSLSSEAQALFDHARNSLPRWLTGAATAALEWLYGFTAVFDAARVQGQDWLDLTYLDGAEGAELDQHAADRGTSRRMGESDGVLRERLRNITDAITEVALIAGINQILEGASLPPSAKIVSLRRDRGHMHAVGSCRAFMSRGYRMTGVARPMSYIVILPFGTDAATGNAVAEYLRKNGPAGYSYFIERRLNP